MMQHEFEALAGYEVTYEDYSKIIEPMYMATSMSKAEFVKCIDRKRFDFRAREAAEKKAMIKAMREIAEERAENCEHWCDWEAENRLYDMARELVARFYPKSLGFHGDIGRKHWKGLERGCTYPATLVIYREIRGEWYEEERIKLAD